MDENSMDPPPYDTINVEEAETNDILLTEKGQKFLRQTRPWVRFMSIMVFISAGFSALAGLMMFIVGMTGNLLGEANRDFPLSPFPGGGFVIGLFYLIMAVVYIPPGIYLTRYASAIKNLESTLTSQALENALKFQKSFWRYVGVLVVIFLIVIAAIMAFSFAIAFFMILNK